MLCYIDLSNSNSVCVKVAEYEDGGIIRKLGVSLNDFKITEITKDFISVDMQNYNLELIKGFILSLSKTVVITAKARSGKDFALALIRDNIDKSEKCSLADPIYKIRDIIYGKTETKNRKELVDIGQGLREVDSSIWIKAWLSNAFNLYREGVTTFICADLRMVNEYNFFRSIGAKIIKIQANEEKRETLIKQIDGYKEFYMVNNPTEKYYDLFLEDYTIENNYDTHYTESILSLVKIITNNS
jgi:hypothetical protein